MKNKNRCNSVLLSCGVFYFRRRASYDVQGPFFGLCWGKDFLYLIKKLENSFEVKQKNLPLVMEAKKDNTTLKKTASLIP